MEDCTEIHTTPPRTHDGKGQMIDYVNAAPHYKVLKPEPIEVIEAWELGPHEANVVKYVARARYKGEELKDLKKALWYLSRKIRLLEGQTNGVRTNAEPVGVVSQPDSAARPLNPYKVMLAKARAEDANGSELYREAAKFDAEGE